MANSLVDLGSVECDGVLASVWFIREMITSVPNMRRPKRVPDAPQIILTSKVMTCLSDGASYVWTYQGAVSPSVPL